MIDGLRDYHTTDGEEYWDVDVFHALDRVLGDMMSWPKVRLLIPATGEIKEGPLRFLVGSIVEAIKDGHDIRLEVVGD